MKTNIKATNIALTEAISDYLTEKLGYVEKLLPAGDDSIIAEVELAKETKHHLHGEVFKAEINLHAGGKNFYSVTHEEDLYAAIDALRDEITRQIKTGFERRNTLLRRGGRKAKAMLRNIYWWRNK
jgi:ribosomal subunit interface protein